MNVLLAVEGRERKASMLSAIAMMALETLMAIEVFRVDGEKPRIGSGPS